MTNNTVNIQQFLNKRLPTKEKRERMISLSFDLSSISYSFPKKEGEKDEENLDTFDTLPERLYKNKSKFMGNNTREFFYFKGGEVVRRGEEESIYMEGELDLTDFIHLESLSIQNQLGISEIKGFQNLKKLEFIFLPSHLVKKVFIDYGKLEKELNSFLTSNDLQQSKDLKQKVLDLEQENSLLKEERENNISNIIDKIHQELKNYNPNLGMIKSEVLEFQVRSKSKGLEKLKNTFKSKLDENSSENLDDLLEVQEELTKSNNSFVQKQLEKYKKKLLKTGKISEKETNQICQLQVELTNLKSSQVELINLKSPQVQLKYEDDD